MIFKIFEVTSEQLANLERVIQDFLSNLCNDFEKCGLIFEYGHIFRFNQEGKHFQNSSQRGYRALILIKKVKGVVDDQRIPAFLNIELEIVDRIKITMPRKWDLESPGFDGLVRIDKKTFQYTMPRYLIDSIFNTLERFPSE